MISLRRYRIAIRCLALVAIMTVASTLAWVSPSRGHLGPIALSIGSAIILLWAVTDAPMCCLEAVEQIRVFRRSIDADSARNMRQFRRKSRFLGSEIRKWFKTGNRAASEVPSPASPFAGKNVLIADDDFEITQMLGMRFEGLGMTVLRTSDALQLLFGVHKVKADLIVVDVNMPTGNGLALCELLNSDKTFARLPVIIYTGSSADDTVRRCRALGAHYVLKAPHSWPEIEKILHRLFNSNVSHEKAPAPEDQQPHETTDRAESVATTSSPDRPCVAPPPAPLRPDVLPSPDLPKSLSENRRGLARFVESAEQNVPVPLSADGSRIGTKFDFCTF